jgi:DNA-directed RNA polymerase
MVARVLESMGLPMVFIHDSFATHCNYRDELYTAIVNTFADLYDMDYLAQLKAYWEERYSVELDPTPELGEWNPDSVRGLKRFFL